MVSLRLWLVWWWGFSLSESLSVFVLCSTLKIILGCETAYDDHLTESCRGGVRVMALCFDRRLDFALGLFHCQLYQSLAGKE